MKKYEYLPHTADAKFRAYGKTLEEAFKNSALAMSDITFKSAAIKPKIKKEIKIKADTLQELLITFLDEFVFLQDTEGFLLGDITFLNIIQEKMNEKKKEIIKDNKSNNEDQKKNKKMDNKKIKEEEKNIVTKNSKTLFKLNAVVTGDHHKNYAMQGQVVKAVTYNDMAIERRKGQWMIQVVVDI